MEIKSPVENHRLYIAYSELHQFVKAVMNNHQKIICPTCGKKNTWYPENLFKPFCSDRCKLIDLGEWASENRNIPGNPMDPEFIREIDNDGDELS